MRLFVISRYLGVPEERHADPATPSVAERTAMWMSSLAPAKADVLAAIAALTIRGLGLQVGLCMRSPAAFRRMGWREALERHQLMSSYYQLS